MSTTLDRIDPHNPLHYAPPHLRDLTEWTERGSEDSDIHHEAFFSPRESYDSILENAVEEALRHPLDPELMIEPPEYKSEPSRALALLGVAGRFATAASVVGAVALFFVFMIPAAQDMARSSIQPGAVLAGFFSSIRSAFEPANADVSARSLKSDAITVATGNQTSATSEQSEKLFQQFVQWQQKDNLKRRAD